MIWSNDEINKAIYLCDKGFNYVEIGTALNRTPKAVKVKLNRLNVKLNDDVNYEIVVCKNCNCEFKSFKNDKRKFCSSSCSATYNNKLRAKKNKKKRYQYNKRKSKYCLNCGNLTTNKFCNSNCQHDYNRKELFINIENNNGVFSHKQIKKYLVHKHGEKCMKCGWNEKHPITGKVPIELEHIDGNSNNNNLNNVTLLCPNCHSLTPTYRALNVGNGRHNRRERYKNKKSY